MIRIAIVEDDDEDYGRLMELLLRFERENGESFSLKRFANGLNFVSEYKPEFDVVFMDIEMPVMDGMKASEKLRQLDYEVTLVFITNMAQYAINGYQVSASDYIVKPLDYPVLKNKMHRILSALKKKKSRKIILKSSEFVQCVLIDDIRFVEVRGHYLTYHLPKEEIVCRGKLSSVEEELGKDSFCRCSDFCLVNMNYVTSYDSAKVYLGDVVIPFSRRRRKEFIEGLSNFIGGE